MNLKSGMTVKNEQRLRELQSEMQRARNEYDRAKSEIDELVSRSYSGKLENARTIARNLYDKHFQNFFSLGQFYAIVPFADRGFTLESAMMSAPFIFTASDHEIASWVRDRAYSRILGDNGSDRIDLDRTLNLERDKIKKAEKNIERVEKKIAESKNQSARIEEILVRNRDKVLKRNVAKKSKTT